MNEKMLRRFSDWLFAHGSEVLATTNDYELSALRHNSESPCSTGTKTAKSQKESTGRRMLSTPFLISGSGRAGENVSGGPEMPASVTC